jgi:hypothetical protein
MRGQRNDPCKQLFLGFFRGAKLMTRKQNIVDNTPASGWRLATKKERRLLGKSVKQPYFVLKTAKQIRKGSPVLTRDAFTVKQHGMHRRALAEFRAKPEGAAHLEHGYKRPLSEKMAELLRKRRYGSAKAKAARLKLVRQARAAFEKDGDDIAAAVQARRDEIAASASEKVKKRMRAAPWTRFKDQLDTAIGPDTGNPVGSRELPPQGHIADGNWHGMIDALKDQLGENSPLVRLLRSSGRYWEGGVWVTE